MIRRWAIFSIIGCLLLALGLWIYWPFFAGTRGALAIEAPRQVAFLEPDPAPLADVLADLVRPGLGVAYEEATSSHKQLLDSYLADVARATPSRFSSDDDRLAFYINAYNALVIRRVLELMPIQSVDDAGPLRAFFRERIHQVAGAQVSLHGFETKIIRQYDPLFHLGLNCASVSCPPLRQEPYRGDILKRQLATATKAFLKNSDYNYFDKTSHTIYVSKIFDWYAADFGGAEGVRKFLLRWGPPHWPKDAKIRFLPYHWNLNNLGAVERVRSPRHDGK